MSGRKQNDVTDSYKILDTSEASQLEPCMPHFERGLDSR